MDFKTEVYCRLCAEFKLNSEIYNYQTDEVTLQQILEKLNRVNAKIDLKLSPHPKTICFKCTDSLNLAFEFVTCVENAQKVLRDNGLLEKIKEEDCLSNNEEMKYNSKIIKTDPQDDTSDESVHIETIKVEFEDRKIQTEFIRFHESAPKPENSSWFDYAWTCSVCEMIFSNSDKLIKHSMDEHSRCNAFCCTICKIHRNCLQSMVKHIYTHDRKLALSCFKCMKSFESEFKMRAHRRNHIHTHYCKNCYMSFDDESELAKHKEIYNRKYKEPVVSSVHVCDVCGKTFQNDRYLTQHMKVHADSKKHECKICKKTFKFIHSLRNHISVHDGEKPFSCEVCGKSFRIKRYLEGHKVVHTDFWPFKCDLCDKRFRYKNKLTLHKMLHSGIVPYTCIDCNWDFNNYSNYFKHMKGKHNIDIRKRKPDPDVTKDHSEWKEWKEQTRQTKITGRPKRIKKEQMEVVKIDKSLEQKL